MRKAISISMLTLSVASNAFAFGYGNSPVADTLNNLSNTVRWHVERRDRLEQMDREDHRRQRLQDIEDRYRNETLRMQQQNERLQDELRQLIAVQKQREAERLAEEEAARQWQEDQDFFFRLYPHYLKDEDKFSKLNDEVIRLATQHPNKDGLKILMDAHFNIEGLADKSSAANK